MVAAADRGKKPKVDGVKEEEDSDQIDPEIVLSIERLQELQDELEKINEEASEKVLKVEQACNQIRKPLFSKRREIIKSIPNFWLTAFLSHPALGDLLIEEDQKLFRYLNSLDVEDFIDGKLGYSITLNFSPNPYFKNTKLTKTFLFSNKGTTKISGTSIRWKKDMDVTGGCDQVKEGNKKRLFNNESFIFIWFSSEQSVLEAGVRDEVAEIIKEELWLNPLKYFTIGGEEEDLDGGDDDDDVGEYNDDDDDDVEDS